MVSILLLGALIVSALALAAYSTRQKLIDEELKTIDAKEQLRAIATKRPRTRGDLPADVFTISITGTFRVDSAFATMPMRGLVRIDPPPAGRKTMWHTMPYSESVPRGNHTIQVMTPYRGRTFINWLILPAPPGPIYTGNPLSLYIDENKSMTAEFT